MDIHNYDYNYDAVCINCGDIFYTNKLYNMLSTGG